MACNHRFSPGLIICTTPSPLEKGHEQKKSSRRIVYNEFFYTPPVPYTPFFSDLTGKEGQNPFYQEKSQPGKSAGITASWPDRENIFVDCEGPGSILPVPTPLQV